MGHVGCWLPEGMSELGHEACAGGWLSAWLAACAAAWHARRVCNVHTATQRRAPPQGTAAQHLSTTAAGSCTATRDINQVLRLHLSTWCRRATHPGSDQATVHPDKPSSCTHSQQRITPTPLAARSTMTCNQHHPLTAVLAARDKWHASPADLPVWVLPAAKLGPLSRLVALHCLLQMPAQLRLAL